MDKGNGWVTNEFYTLRGIIDLAGAIEQGDDVFSVERDRVYPGVPIISTIWGRKFYFD